MKTIQLRQASDTDLLEFICSNDASEEAYGIFVNRYIKDLGDECAKICDRRKLDKHVGMQIAHEVFEKIKKYRSFDKTKLKGNIERESIMRFMFTISLNLFRDYHKKGKENNTTFTTYFDDLASTVKLDVKDNKLKKDFTLRILKKLNPKEVKVLLADIEYKRHYRYLPDDVVASLCKELNVKESGVRKLRERLTAKIKKEIDAINREQ
ncbi:DNA-directed RNA polymerase specialized sigma subunit, sigma24 family [Pedobacter sp. ok626]|uniref:sigma-70 family RNA polymerase sigma factor n=1 Tax=Pedobacter sp. ok626 TaxID=1761882 RepID=UPI000890E655|nr:sigma-70 family RNA polymerase sigma factor [Pedobacter sp. ok626]SDL67387.1 DNA-directed RNA polymerase specialized sigma subunit, sigma24 family [Pedobacter sp. ok626]